MADDVKNNLLLLNVYDVGASVSEIGCASHGRRKGTLKRAMLIRGRGDILKFHCSLNGAFNGAIDAERASAVICVGKCAPTNKLSLIITVLELFSFQYQSTHNSPI